MPMFSRKVDYALLILSDLLEGAESRTAREIAEHFDLSRPFVANILKELCQSGFVDSIRGAKGGYVLSSTCTQSSLADLLHALNEGFQLTECTQHPNENSSGSGTGNCALEECCTLKKPLKIIHTRIMNMLADVRLENLLKGKSGNLLVSLPLLQPRPTEALIQDSTNYKDLLPHG